MTSPSSLRSSGWLHSSSEGNLLQFDYTTPTNGREAFMLSNYFVSDKNGNFEQNLSLYINAQGELTCAIKPLEENQLEIEFTIELMENNNYVFCEVQYPTIKKLEERLLQISNTDIISNLSMEYSSYLKINREDALKRVLEASNLNQYLDVYVLIPSEISNKLLLISSRDKVCVEKEFLIHPGLLSRVIEDKQYIFPNIDFLIKYTFTTPTISLATAERKHNLLNDIKKV